MAKPACSTLLLQGLMEMATETRPVLEGGDSTYPHLIFRRATTQTHGKEALHGNITAAKVVTQLISSCLGPCGMDKMLIPARLRPDALISSDGATILKEIQPDVLHPAARTLIDVAKTTGRDVGDGTTSVVILAGHLLHRAEGLIDKDIHPIIIGDGYVKALEKAVEICNKIAIETKPVDAIMLKKVAMTSMAKVVSNNRVHLADLAVIAALQVAQKTEKGYKVDIDDIRIEKRRGASLDDTKLIWGICLDKAIVRPDMPKRIERPRIALLECGLNIQREIEKRQFPAKIEIETPDEIKHFLEEEKKILKEMIDKIVTDGANVVLCHRGIDDVAQYFLAKRGVLAVKEVAKPDLLGVSKATGGRIATSVDTLTPSDLGRAELVEERKLGKDRWTFIEGCRNPRSVTILIRGGSEKVVEEARRSIHQAMCAIRNTVDRSKVVVGGGAVEMEIACQLRAWARSISGREQLAVLEFANALEAIPLTLAKNRGLEPIDVQVELRARHEKWGKWFGVDSLGGKVEDMTRLDVYEPLSVKEQVIKSACEAALMILRVDGILVPSEMNEKITHLPASGGKVPAVLKEGWDHVPGRLAQRNNIRAVRAIDELLRSTLGPRGMDKMIVDDVGDFTVSNDGATLLAAISKEIEMRDPAAKIIFDVARVQDEIVGDGATTVVILIGELLRKAEELLDQNIHANVIVSGYKKALENALEELHSIAVDVNIDDKETLRKVASTALKSKWGAQARDTFIDIAVKAVSQIVERRAERLVADVDQIQTIKELGGGVGDMQLIRGVIVSRQLVNPDMPRRIEKARIALSGAPLEVRKSKINTEVRFRETEQIRALHKADAKPLKEIVDKIKSSGAMVIFCKGGIDDIAGYFLAKEGMLAVCQASDQDMDRLQRATGAKLVANLDDLKEDDLGYADLVEERKFLDEDKLIFVEGCKNPKSVSIVVRGGVPRLVDDIARAMHDAFSAVANVYECNKIVAGGGSLEAELAKRLRSYAERLGSREQLAVAAFAESLEVIPKTLARNAGFNPLDILPRLREAHDRGEGLWTGPNIFTGEIVDMMKQGVLEPLRIKEHAIKSAVEVVSTIIRIDEVIVAARTERAPETEDIDARPNRPEG